MRCVQGIVFCWLMAGFVGPATAQTTPIVIADFEGSDYAGWKATGTAFGEKPAAGTLPGQMPVEGFLGKGLVNSFLGGDNPTGTLTSPAFKIERKFITFLIGGGGWADETGMNLLLDGKVVRTATGTNTNAGGSERLALLAWDVAEYAGREVSIQIIDHRSGGWGHINVDHILQTDDRGEIPIAVPPPALVKNVTKDVVAEQKWLHFPVKTGAKPRVVTVAVDGAVVRRFDIELADVEPDWWAPLDISAWKGKSLHIVADVLPEGSQAFEKLPQSTAVVGSENLYQEALRPQLQFSPKRGWANDPNGLVFFRGEYHLFFQHNPYGWNWGNMHWGHATSHDLMHWQEHGEALYPDDMGPMFSGSAIVDWKNHSGLGKDGQPPMLLFYTAAGNPTTQCLAYSLDGRTFTKFSGNPIIKQVTPGNRDPKVLWHEPSQQWVLTLYVEVPRDKKNDDSPNAPKTEHVIQFFTSKNLKDWTYRSQSPGLFECPDFFELPVDGNAANKKWVLTAASSEYLVGRFDGEKFTPETGKLPGHRGRGFYAAQTYSDVPDGRRIQIGWGQAPSPKMPFNQLQTIPCELSLRSTAEGPRLRWQPVKEFDTLRQQNFTNGKEIVLRDGEAHILKELNSELQELSLTFKPENGARTTVRIRGIDVVYDAAKQEIALGNHRAPAPLMNGEQHLHLIIDRTLLTIWASDGLTYIPWPVIPAPKDVQPQVSVAGGSIRVSDLSSSKLRSIWEQGP